MRGQTPEIVIVVDPEGGVTVDGQNFEGTTCDQWVKPIAEAMGTVEHHETKPEYHERTAQRAGQAQTRTVSRG